MVDAGGASASTGGGSSSSSSTSSSGGASGAAAAYRTFRALVERADRKFARVRDLPVYGREGHPHCQRKVFEAYTRLWRFQQEHRKELVEAGMRRWEIGEVASRIGQVYYGQYLRTSDVRFLLESYVFYEAILGRGYFERGKEAACGRSSAGKQQQLSDLGVRCKELRFYARFAVVALLMNRRQMVATLVDKFRALVDDCRVRFPETNFKEWRQVLQEIVRFLKADVAVANSRPLRYCLLFDSHPSSHSYIARLHPKRALRLQQALLASYYRNEVKFTELTLDTFRMLQCLEWEPSGSFYRMHATEPTGNGTFTDQSGASGLIDINLAADMTDPSLPPNPRKSILYRPSVSHLIAVLAAISEDISPEGILLIYLSASGKCEQTVYFQKDNPGVSNNCCGTGLCFDSRANSGLNYIYPSDLIPFTRRSLFLIIDSDNSHAFKVLYGAERVETPVLLLSPERSISQIPSTADRTSNGSLFTNFLASPLQAFCQLVGLSDIDPETYNSSETILLAAFAQWEVVLCTSECLSQVYAQVLPDPFLRRLITRFIFCRSVLSLFRLTGKGSEYLPDCLPNLPDSLSPNSSSVQSGIIQVAESLGVSKHFHLSNTDERPMHSKEL